MGHVILGFSTAENISLSSMYLLTTGIYALDIHTITQDMLYAGIAVPLVFRSGYM